MLKIIEMIMVAPRVKYNAKFIAKEILNACESKGMMPPIKDNPIKVKKNKDGSYYIKLWEWDKE